MMEMQGCCYYGIDDVPPPCSSWSPSSPTLLVSDHHDGMLHAAGDHGCMTADLVIRDEEMPGYLPITASAAAYVDYHQLQADCFVSLLPATAASAGAATAGGHDDELLSLPCFSDIDLDAFADVRDVGELKASPQHSLHAVISPAGGHRFGTQNDACHEMEFDMKQQDKAARGGGGDDSLSMVVVEGYEMGVRFAAEQKPRTIPAATTETPLPLPPPPPPRRLRSRRDGSAATAAAGKTRLDHIGFEDLRRYFYMPITKAAREMNVGLTVLKKRCRELGVTRWPHRKMKSLRSLILNVQEMGSKGMSVEAMRRELEALESCCSLMEENPAVELTERTKKLRQACFKENYKRRRAAAVDVLDQYCFSFAGHGHHHHHHQQLALPLAPATAGHHRGESFGY